MLLSTFSACKKDEISRAKTNLTRSWTVHKIEIGNKDTTDGWKKDHIGYSLQFSKDGKYQETFQNQAGTNLTDAGQWTLSDDALILNLFSTNKSIGQSFTIILVDEANLNCYKTGSNPKETYYFKAF